MNRVSICYVLVLNKTNGNTCAHLVNVFSCVLLALAIASRDDHESEICGRLYVCRCIVGVDLVMVIDWNLNLNQTETNEVKSKKRY